MKANEHFYEVFSRGDVEAMDALWADAPHVTCLHPGMRLLAGRAAVMGSWESLLSRPPTLRLRCDHASVQLLGSVAVVTCYEGGGAEPAHLAATNVFVKDGEHWRMVHHHAGPLTHPVPRQDLASLN